MGKAHRSSGTSHPPAYSKWPKWSITTVAGLQLGYLLGGLVIIEEVFTLPGIGRLVLWAIYQRDYPVILGTILFIGFSFMMINFIVDLIYVVLNPRIRYQEGS